MRLAKEELDRLQRDTFSYFLKETNPVIGLVRDNTRSDAPASITAVGLSLAAFTLAVERGYVDRAEAVTRILTTLRFFNRAPHGPEPDATGYDLPARKPIEFTRGMNGVPRNMQKTDPRRWKL
jgi:hypothetical protein